MKVLFISNYRDGTGYAHAAQQYILAMDFVGIDVVPRCIKLNNYAGEVPERIIELEQKTERGCNICVQFSLPHFFEYDGNFDKNIGLFCWETSNFIATGWHSYLNLMDEVWVPCSDMINVCKNSMVNVPVKVVNIPCNPSTYCSYYEPYEIDEINDTFVFYFIGELSPRKNIDALIKAFHIEFGLNENVSLIIKCNKSGLSPSECANFINEKIATIKSSLKLFGSPDKYRQEIIIPSRLSNEEIMRLHTTCDCLVAPSRYEAWNIGCFDAMCMGKTPIATNAGGPTDYLDGAGILLNGIQTPVSDMSDYSEQFYTGREVWYDIDILQLGKAMRLIYENENIRNQLANTGINRSIEFSYEVIGSKIMELLNEDQSS